MKKRSAIIIVLALSVLVFGGLLYFRSFNRGDKPNVIFILLDAARADRFGCYGYSRDTSPNFDQVAESGAVFLNHFSNATKTRPSVPSYFYSRYFIKSLLPADRSIPLEEPENLFRALDQECVSVTELLKLNGYKTVLFSAHPWLIRGYELVKDFDEFYKVSSRRSAHARAGKVFTRVIDWLKKSPPQPFYIYIHLMDTHFPHERKKETTLFADPEYDYRKKFNRRGFPLSLKVTAGGVDYMPPDFLEEDEQYLNALYDGDIKYTDARFGYLVQFLKEQGLYDNTLLLITSDHGSHLGEHGHLQHASLPWDSVTKIPLIMRLPGKISPGTKVRYLTENVDILPTLVELLNLSLPVNKTFDGKSVFSRRLFFWPPKKYVLTPNSIRSQRYKFIRDPIKGRDYLYDLKNDPSEKKNLIGEKSSLARELKNTMEQLLARSKVRYEKAVSRETPGLPFAISADYFKLSGTDNIEVVQRHESLLDDEEILAQAVKSPLWIHNQMLGRYYLLGFNQGALAPITISFPVPNGKYKVTVACLSGKDVQGYPGSIFKISMNQDDPQNSILVDTSAHSGQRHFPLGEVEIDEEQFKAYIYPVSEPAWIIMRYFGFESVLAAEEGKALSREQRQERLDKLKSLGYVQ